MIVRAFIFGLFAVLAAFSQAPPPIEPGVSQSLAQWRAFYYSDVRYKLNLTLEKMSPLLKGSIEIRLNLRTLPPGTHFGEGLRAFPPGATEAPKDTGIQPIILDWRKIAGHERDSTVSNVTLNGKSLANPPVTTGGSDPGAAGFEERSEHLIFHGVVPGENVIKLDFTSPILTSGSAITRYVDKEDGAEYIYSLFVPSDASTAFPVFDQPDLKAYFQLEVDVPKEWNVISNGVKMFSGAKIIGYSAHDPYEHPPIPRDLFRHSFFHSGKPISSYIFAFAAGPFQEFQDPRTHAREAFAEIEKRSYAGQTVDDVVFSRLQDEAKIERARIFVRRSQATKFQPHSAEVFRLTREGVKYLETYFDYKFPWPKYDLVLIPEFPFGGMEHAGATFVRETNIIFPTEPTKGDYISRANLLFHETAHQWFGDTVTMRWFDDLWLKEGFAEFMAYKTLEKVMPDANAWKVFYERNKQTAYATDSTRGTTPIYQPIANLSAAKSAYGNIVYRKAPSFLRQAEFYLGEDKFQTAVRAFLKKHEYSNAGWEDLVKEFENSSGRDLKTWAAVWVKQKGLPKLRLNWHDDMGARGMYVIYQTGYPDDGSYWRQRLSVLVRKGETSTTIQTLFGAEAQMNGADSGLLDSKENRALFTGEYPKFIFPNSGDYGYGIFLLDRESREYVQKNIQNEKDPFLRSMMWGALWDSVREAEMDPREYVELVIRNLSAGPKRSTTPAAKPATPPNQGGEQDETITASLLAHVGTAMNYYVSTAQAAELAPRLEDVLLDRLQHAPAAGQRITFYRAFVNYASTEHGRVVLKEMLRQGSTGIPTLRTTDKFDIVTRLIILGDPDAAKLLADVEKVEKGDDARRYGFGARAAYPTPENKAKYWSFFVNNSSVAESWIDEAMGPFNSIRHGELTRPYLERALAELPNLRRTRKIFFVNNWLRAWIGGQRDEQALAIVNKFLADNPKLDNDLRLKILENVDLIERAVKIRSKYGRN